MNNIEHKFAQYPARALLEKYIMQLKSNALLCDRTWTVRHLLIGLATSN